MRLTFAAAFILLLCPVPAFSCWSGPTETCFAKQWTAQALAHYAEGPPVARLYDLIDWDVVPSGQAAARTLLGDLDYEDLLAHELRRQEQAGPSDSSGNPLLDIMFPNGLDEPSLDLAVMLMLGYFNAADPDEIEAVPSDHLMAIRNIAVQSGDADKVRYWTSLLPDYLLASPELLGTGAGADGAPMSPQAHAIATLEALRDGDSTAAVRSAASAEGEPAFLAWLAIARAAIDRDDMSLLDRAITGMAQGFANTSTVEMTEEEFDRALAAAEAEYATTGDADRIVHLYESLETTGGALPEGVRLSIALARRVLNLRTGQDDSDDFYAVLSEVEDAFRTRMDEDDITLMRNARTALRLGLDEEADRIIDLAFTHFPGVPSFELDDLPDAPAPWANAWLNLMLARYDAIAREPSELPQRDYWDVWLAQYALSESIDAMRVLARYDRITEAHAFADRAEAYLHQLAASYPKYSLGDLATLFRTEVALILLPPDESAAHLREMGVTEASIALAFARTGRFELAADYLSQAEGMRNLPYWMRQVPNVPAAQRQGFVDKLTMLIDEEMDRVAAYPMLVQELFYEATLFHAEIADWRGAKHYFDRIEDMQSDATLPATLFRLLALRDLSRMLADQAAKPILYPFDDFAL